jgi:hypothetical protein
MLGALPRLAFARPLKVGVEVLAGHDPPAAGTGRALRKLAPKSR